MTSYDEENGGPDFNPAYGIHLHDPRLLEYVGAQSRLDCSAVVRSTGFITWDVRRRGPDFVKHSGPPAVRHIPQPDVFGGHARRL